MLRHPPGYEHNQKSTNRYPLPDSSVPWPPSKVNWQEGGDYYCPNCPKRWFSENTVVWAVYNYFKLAGYAPELTDQLKREGDIRVVNRLKTEEWIIETKGQAPAGDSGSFLEGLGQILKARCGRDPNIFYALAMPHRKPFIEEADQIDGKDRACLRLHWIWVEQVENSHCTRFEVKINCPPGSTCECQKQIGTLSFWGKNTRASTLSANPQAEA